MAAPTTPAVSANPVTLTNSRPGDGNGPRWLSATFSPAENQRLDSSTENIVRQAASSASDSQARFSLQPTRVTSQTFCMVAGAPVPVHDDISPQVPLSAGEPEINPPATPLRPQPPNKARPQSVEEASRRAIRDAAILGWPFGRQPAESGSMLAAVGNAAAAVREEPFLGNDKEMVDEQAETWRWAEQFLVDEKQLVGALLAVIAMKSMHSLEQAEPARSPRRQVELLRRFKPRIVAEHGVTPRSTSGVAAPISRPKKDLSWCASN
jgi:hypothetical protein